MALCIGQRVVANQYTVYVGICRGLVEAAAKQVEVLLENSIIHCTSSKGNIEEEEEVQNTVSDFCTKLGSCI